MKSLQLFVDSVYYKKLNLTVYKGTKFVTLKLKSSDSPNSVCKKVINPVNLTQKLSVKFEIEISNSIAYRLVDSFEFISEPTF